MDASLTPLPIATPIIDEPSAVSPPVPTLSDAADRPARMTLTRRQKAAVIVRLLLSEGATLPLGDLSEDAQVELTEEFGGLRLVDRDTLASVAREFVEEMEAIGLTFPGGIEGALGLLDGHISPATAARLRREAGVAARGDPWQRMAGLTSERLQRVLETESAEVGAVLLSKLPVTLAAELLSQLPGNHARALSLAISRTGQVLPETVQRIGLSLAAQLDAEPVNAFDDVPVERVGAILNFSRAATRDDVLVGLDETDAEFAAEVRRTIFTFASIPARITPQDIPRIIRGLDQPVLVTALAFAQGEPTMERAREFVLENMSKRMADSLREEVEDTGAIRPDGGEAAMNAVVGHIRSMVDAGELMLVSEDE